MKVELDRVEGKTFGKRSGEQKGSRKFGRISDDFGEWLVKWQRGEWKIVSRRWNTKVATSLNTRAMTQAIENGREVAEVERYVDFDRFAKRLAAIVGPGEAFRIVQWIKG